MPEGYKTPDMKRIFIAIKNESGDRLNETVSDFMNVLRAERIRWTDPGNMHVTLAFPGNTRDDAVEGIKKMLESTCTGYGHFTLVIKGAGVFRSLKDPRVIWLGIEQSDMLDSLAGKVKSGLSALGIALEDRPFNPHLTLGRIKGLSDIGFLQALLDKYAGVTIFEQKVPEVILYESILMPEGPVYKPLGAFRLS